MAFTPYSVSPLSERPQPGAEADEELGDLHAGALGDVVVPGLVEHDHRDDPE